MGKDQFSQALHIAVRACDRCELLYHPGRTEHRPLIGQRRDPGQFLADLAAGGNPKLKVKSGFQIGVRVVVSPFPFDDDATFFSVSKHAAILFKKGIPAEVHIEDVMQVNGQW